MSRTASLQLPAALADLDDLPTPPSVALEVARLSRLDTTRVDDLGKVIATDPSLAAQLLRVVNSAASGLPKSIDSIPRACALLGFRQTRDLALAFSVSNSLPVVGADTGCDLSEYWLRSSMTAAACRVIAERVHPDGADTAFAVGLLSELGRLVLANSLTDQYKPVLALAPWPSLALEREHLGFTNLDVTSGLLHKWQLPDELTLPIAYRDYPEDLPEGTSREAVRICRILATARVLAVVWAEGADETSLRWATDGAAHYLRMTPETFQQVLEQLQAEVDEGVGGFTDVTPPPLVDKAELQRRAQEQLSRVIATGRTTSRLASMLKG